MLTVRYFPVEVLVRLSEVLFGTEEFFEDWLSLYTRIALPFTEV